MTKPKRKSAQLLPPHLQHKYISIAHDAYGMAIRDNTRLWKIEMGRRIELDGHDPNPYPYPCECDFCKTERGGDNHD